MSALSDVVDLVREVLDEMPNAANVSLSGEALAAALSLATGGFCTEINWESVRWRDASDLDDARRRVTVLLRGFTAGTDGCLVDEIEVEVTVPLPTPAPWPALVALPGGAA